MSNAPEIGTLDKISIIVQRYQEIPVDFRDIDKLTYWQRKMACALFDYSGEVGDLYKGSKGTEYTRKAAYEKERLRLMTEDGKSAAAADAEARAKVSNELFDEVAADADYRAALMQMQAARDVLEAMRQHISSLKQELKLETYGQGSQ